MPADSKTRERAAAWSRRTFVKSAAAGLALGAPGRLAASRANQAADLCRIVFDLDPDPKNEAVLDWLRRGGYCWGIEAPWQTSTERLRWLRAQGWEVVLKLKAHPATQARHHAYKRWPVPDAREVLQRHLDAADGDRARVIWQILLEDDSAGVGHPQELFAARPRTHAEAAALLQRHVAETVAASVPAEKIRRWSVCGFAATAHAFARQEGVDLVTVERANDDVDDLQTGIAFARGAGRQHGKMWGIDLSLWWGVIHGTVADLPASYHRRQLFLAWYAGAQHLRIEGGDLFLERRTRQLTPLARCMDEFGAHTRRHERGSVETPVAVMLPPDHGWITPPPWRTTREAWNYARLPYRQGQRAIDGFFAHAYPGSGFAMQPFPFGRFTADDPPPSPFALSSVTSQFTSDPTDVRQAEPPLPFGRFHDRREAARSLREGKIDPAPHRPMGQSRWGDILDVLTPDAAPEALERYRVLVLLDQIRLEPARLAAFLARGGTVVCAAGVAGPSHRELIGAEIVPELRVGHAWRWGDAAPVRESFQHVTVNSCTARVLARAANGAPLLLEQPHGAGRVITCLVPWFEGSGSDLCGVAAAAFDQVISAVQPVHIEGLPIQWISTRRPGAHTVVLSNNDDREWTGRVTVHVIEPGLRSCRELLAGRELETARTGESASVALAVPPFGLTVVEWTAA